MSEVRQKRAVVLVSGGLDSSTTLAIARDAGFVCYALSFDYGQRHRAELQAAARVAAAGGAIEHRLMTVGLGALGGSALTDANIAVPEAAPNTPVSSTCIPVTYVPARNLIFLSLATAWAEVLGAEAIYIGANAVDYSGYPDCRPAFLESFATTANLATKVGVEGAQLRIEAPLLHWSKAEIIQHGQALGVDFAQTVSCYQADEGGRACGRCESCRLRAAGFSASGLADPTHYQAQYADVSEVKT
jgi:7-cyano-7-deazaguanine synthase